MTPIERYAARIKSPAGAAKTNETVTFTLGDLPGVKSVWLLIRRDDERSISRTEFVRGEQGFALSHTYTRAGLYFYAIQADDGRWLHGFEQGGAVFGAQPMWAQQTVVCEAYKPADSFFGGIAYQIFPDRFAIGGYVRRLPGRRYHESRNEPPEWRPDADGKVRNLDFYGGDFAGIRHKLPYLRSLGVTLIYLNPIFEARSNHRYDTGDYLKIDPQLGTEADFTALCSEAKQLGIRIILDGVFSHTGDDSRYFNRYGRYDSLGAYQSKDSPYHSWFKFKNWPDDFESWWGVQTLPEVNEENPDYVEFICGEGGVIDHWMKAGASGFRLDVADELPDSFIQKIRAAVRRCDEQGLVIGEVWEDASNKISYDVRRQYFWGRELDGTINYPFRNAVLDFIRSTDAAAFERAVQEILLHYPAEMLCSCLNILSSHDTARAINALAAPDALNQARSVQADRKLSLDEYLRGVEMLKLAYALLYMLPGIPMVYYGDEVGMQGYGDPFCRGFFNWHGGDEILLSSLRTLGGERTRFKDALCGSEMEFFHVGDGAVGFYRGSGYDRIAFLLNRSEQTVSVQLDNGDTITAEPWRYTLQECAKEN
ncbi:MAG: glycoside hydrolase family 13 protein [Oscillospiraceae bacterium]|nr:glycoside hydrolase family 13 protein [Oscillospiraceae bacterium]